MSKAGSANSLADGLCMRAGNANWVAPKVSSEDTGGRCWAPGGAGKGWVGGWVAVWPAGWRVSWRVGWLAGRLLAGWLAGQAGRHTAGTPPGHRSPDGKHWGGALMVESELRKQQRRSKNPYLG